jgi:hypothetical protein
MKRLLCALAVIIGLGIATASSAGAWQDPPLHGHHSAR